MKPWWCDGFAKETRRKYGVEEDVGGVMVELYENYRSVNQRINKERS